MAEAHMGSILPIKNRVLGVDANTAALFHYDLNEHDVLTNKRANGAEKEVRFGGTYIKAEGPQYAITKEITMAAWVKPTDASASDRDTLIIGKPSSYYFTISKALQVSAYWYAKTPSGYHSSTATCPLNKWTHVAMSWSMTELKLYVNGVLDSTFQTTGDGGTPTGMDIGSEGNNNRFFRGGLRDLGIWSTVKTGEEIKSIMQSGIRGNERGLRGFWKMDEGEGQILYDDSAFHQDIKPSASTNISWDQGDSVFTLREKEGRFGGAIAVEEGTTNLVSAYLPEFENLPIGGKVEKAYTTTEIADAKVQWTRLGKHKWKVTFLTDFPGRVQVDMTNTMSWDTEKTVSYELLEHYLVPGSTGTFSVSRVSYGNIYNNEPGQKSITYPITETNWQGVTGVGFRTSWADGAVIKAGSFMVFQNIQVEQKAFATSFTEGNRSPGRLSYEMETLGISPLSDWTISGWFKRHPGVSNWSGLFGMGGYYLAGESEFMIWSNHNGQLKMFSHDNKSGRSLTLIGDPNPGELEEWFYLAVTHRAATDEYVFYVFTKDRYVKNERILAHANPIAPTLCIGGTASSSHVFNGLVDEVRIDKVVRSEEEIVAWHESNSPFWPRGIYRKSY